MSVKKGILDVKLTNEPMKRDNYIKNGAYCYWFDDWAEGFNKINSFTLIESFGHKTGLVSIYGFIKSLFNSICPPAPNDIM